MIITIIRIITIMIKVTLATTRPAAITTEITSMRKKLIKSRTQLNDNVYGQEQSRDKEHKGIQSVSEG